MNILAIDPGTKCGFATDGVFAEKSGVRDLSPKKEKKRPPTPAEPEEARCGRVNEFVRTYLSMSTEEMVVVCEGAMGFSRGQSAVKVGHEIRGAIKAACWLFKAKYIEVQPHVIKKFATGHGNADKSEMVDAARNKLGYLGESDDEADALWILRWAQSSLK